MTEHPSSTARPSSQRRRRRRPTQDHTGGQRQTGQRQADDAARLSAGFRRTRRVGGNLHGHRPVAAELPPVIEKGLGHGGPWDLPDRLQRGPVLCCGPHDGRLPTKPATALLTMLVPAARIGQRLDGPADRDHEGQPERGQGTDRPPTPDWMLHDDLLQRAPPPSDGMPRSGGATNRIATLRPVQNAIERLAGPAGALLTRWRVRVASATGCGSAFRSKRQGPASTSRQWNRPPRPGRCCKSRAGPTNAWAARRTNRPCRLASSHWPDGRFRLGVPRHPLRRSAPAIQRIGAGRAVGPTARLVRSRAACKARRVAAGSDRSARALSTGRIRKLGCSTQVGT